MSSLTCDICSFSDDGKEGLFCKVLVKKVTPNSEGCFLFDDSTLYKGDESNSIELNGGRMVIRVEK